MDMTDLEKHPNWVYIGGYVLYLIIAIILSDVPHFIFWFMVMLPTSVWVLQMKKRSLWWVLLMGLFSPLLVRNHSQYSDYQKAIDEKAAMDQKLQNMQTTQDELLKAIKTNNSTVLAIHYTTSGNCDISNEKCVMEKSIGAHTCETCKVSQN